MTTKCFLFSIVILFFSCSIAVSQTSLRFQVKDKISYTPLPFSRIALFDAQKLLVKTISNDEGYFYIDPVVVNGKKDLVISIEFFGYHKLSSAFNSKDSIFFLELSPKELKQVTISAKRKLISIDPNKITYEVARDSLNNRGNASNAMRQIPGLDISLTGEVSAGTKDILYMLNGQEDALVSSGKALSSLPARFISRIELITDPDPKYRERGYQLIINLVSKADIVEGNLGSLSVSGDTQSGYSGRFSFYHRKNSFSINLNSQTNHSENSLNESTAISKTGDHQDLVSSAFFKNTRYSNSLELNYVVGKALLYAYGNQGNSHNDQLKNDQYSRNNIPLYEIAARVNQHFASYHTGAGIRLNQILKNSNGMIGFSFSNSPGSTRTRNDVLPRDSIHTGSSHAAWKELILQGTFSTKVTAKFAFDYGLKGVYRRSSTFTNNSWSRAGSDVLLQDDSSVYNQDIHSVFWYTKINPVNKLQLSLGARAEQSVLHSRINSSDLFKKYYLNVLPRVNASWKTTKTEVLSFAYRLILKRPSISYISPFVNTSNSLLSTSGNPDLQPEQFHSFDLGYALYPGKFYVNPDLYISFSNNSIQKIAVPGNGQSFLSTYQNGGKSIFKALYLGLGGPLTKKIRLTMNGGIGTSYIRLNDVAHKNTFYTISFSNSYDIGKGFRSQITGFFNSASVEAQGYSTGTNMYSAGFSRSFRSDKSSITLSVSDPLLKRRGTVNVITDSDYAITSRQWRPARLFTLNYFYKFGKLKETYVTRGGRTSVDDLKNSN